MTAEERVKLALKYKNYEIIKDFYNHSSISVTTSHPTDNSVTYNVSITVKTEE